MQESWPQRLSRPAARKFIVCTVTGHLQLARLISRARHYTYMKEKSYQQGPLELIQYTISESPEYEFSGSWHEGEFPATTGRTIFTLFEIYRTPDGLHHHFIDGKDFGPELFEIATTYNIEFHLMNQMKVIQSLWDCQRLVYSKPLLLFQNNPIIDSEVKCQT